MYCCMFAGTSPRPCGCRQLCKKYTYCRSSAPAGTTNNTPPLQQHKCHRQPRQPWGPSPPHGAAKAPRAVARLARATAPPSRSVAAQHPACSAAAGGRQHPAQPRAAGASLRRPLSDCRPSCTQNRSAQILFAAHLTSEGAESQKQEQGGGKRGKFPVVCRARRTEVGGLF